MIKSLIEYQSYLTESLASLSTPDIKGTLCQQLMHEVILTLVSSSKSCLMLMAYFCAFLLPMGADVLLTCIYF